MTLTYFANTYHANSISDKVRRGYSLIFKEPSIDNIDL